MFTDCKSPIDAPRHPFVRLPEAKPAGIFRGWGPAL